MLEFGTRHPPPYQGSNPPLRFGPTRNISIHSECSFESSLNLSMPWLQALVLESESKGILDSGGLIQPPEQNLGCVSDCFVLLCCL